MYIKIADEKTPLKDFKKTTNYTLFAFNQDIESDTFTDVSSFEMYSDDDMFLSEYILKDYKLVCNGNELYLKDKDEVIDIEAIKTDRVLMSKILLSEWLESHPYLYSDGKYYTCTEEKQSLLNGNLASYERAKAVGVDYPLKWNSTGDECIEWTYDGLVGLSLGIAAYVAPRVSHQQEIEILINACESVEELDKVVISYD